MWWTVGAVVALLTIILFVRSRAKGRKRNRVLVAAAQNHLNVCLMTVSGSLGEYDNRVWTDSYLLGYMQGTVGMLCHFFGGSMTTEQKGMVYIDVLERLNPDGWLDVAERTSSLATSNDSDFQRGVKHAADVVALTTNQLRPEFMNEPDIQAALNMAPHFERTAQMFGEEVVGSASPYMGAGAALMGTYMNRHKKLLGA